MAHRVSGFGRAFTNSTLKAEVLKLRKLLEGSITKRPLLPGAEEA